MQNIVRRRSFLSLVLILTIGLILACGAGSPTVPEAPVPQIIYNDGIARLREPVPEISVCERNNILIAELQSGQRSLDGMYEQTKRHFVPPADSRTPYPAWMAKEYKRLDAQHRTASARYQQAALIASGLSPDAFAYCAGYNDQYPGPRKCRTAFSELIAGNDHLNPSLYQLGAIRACLETNAYQREPIGSP